MKSANWLHRTVLLLQAKTNNKRINKQSIIMCYYSDNLSYEEQLKDVRWRRKRIHILERDGYQCRMCGTSGSGDNPLEIHHRYYEYDALAWEYNDSALVTLCNDCHDLVHKTISPLCYSRNGEQLIPMNFTPCYRCGGSGYFREYRHILGGICFRCRGLRYEELFNTSEEIDQYALSNEDCFDVLSPSEDQTAIFECFRNGKDCHFGINGKPFDLEKAYAYYRKASLNGYGQAQNNCGVLLKNKGDYKNALRWFVYAAMQGIPQAQSNISKLFEEGHGVVKVKELADIWRDLASDNKNEHIKLDNLKDFEKMAEGISQGDKEATKALCSIIGQVQKRDKGS